MKRIGIAAGIFIVLAALFLLPMARTMMSFKPAPTGAVTKEFFALKDKFVDIFIFKSGEDLYCFDAGNKPEEVLAGFKELGLDPLKVKAVFLTHSDGDHVNGLPAMKNAVVYLPEKEKPLVTGAAKRHFMFMSRVNKLPVAKYLLAKDGQKFKIGKALCLAILTPGHTPGSTSYLINGKYLVVGDLAITKNGKLTGMPKPPSEEPAVIEVSLKKINALNGVEYIATAHGGVIKLRK
ncbi:MAG: MBL fold metallo-hydrolase [Candidatus Firestonebacteria bacterium]